MSSVQGNNGRNIHKVAALLVRIEAGFLAALAGYLLLRTATSEVEELDAVIAEIVFLIFGAIGLFFAGQGFLKQRYYGRGSTVMANLIALGVAYYMIDGGRLVMGLTLGVFAIATLLAAIAAVPGQTPHQGTTS